MINTHINRENVELCLVVAIEAYVILALTYGALAVAGYLPMDLTSRRVLAASLAVFAIVRLVVAIARGRRVVK